MEVCLPDSVKDGSGRNLPRYRDGSPIYSGAICPCATGGTAPKEVSSRKKEAAVEQAVYWRLGKETWALGPC